MSAFLMYGKENEEMNFRKASINLYEFLESCYCPHEVFACICYADGRKRFYEDIDRIEAENGTLTVKNWELELYDDNAVLLVFHVKEECPIVEK